MVYVQYDLLCGAEARSNVTVRLMLPSLSHVRYVMSRMKRWGRARPARKIQRDSRCCPKKIQMVALRLGSDSLSFHRRSDKRIGIRVLEQINHGTVHQLQTPLCSLELYLFVSICLSAISFHPRELTIPILVFLKLLNLILACCLVPLTQYTTSIFPCSWLISPPI